MNRKLLFVLSAVLVLAFVLSACASSTPVQPVVEPEAAAPDPVVATETPAAPEAAAPVTPEAEGLLPVVDPAAVTGDIITAGSSTVFPLSEAIASLFESEGYTGQVTIDSIGTGGGFERFCATGETDVANASRAIKDSEAEKCAALSPARTPIEYRVGTDALAVVVSKENTFLTDVTLEELAKIFSKDATKWSDIRPEWPAEDILRYSPGTDSGTFDYFVEAVMDPVYEGDGMGEEAILSAANLQLSEDDNVLVQGVEGSPYAIGYFGFAYYTEEQARLTALSIGGVAPDAQTAEDGSYPLARPLFIYSDAAIMKAKPQVAQFIAFYLTRVNEVIGDVGYFPASADALLAAQQAWLDAMK